MSPPKLLESPAPKFWPFVYVKLCRNTLWHKRCGVTVWSHESGMSRSTPYLYVITSSIYTFRTFIAHMSPWVLWPSRPVPVHSTSTALYFHFVRQYYQVSVIVYYRQTLVTIPLCCTQILHVGFYRNKTTGYGIAVADAIDTSFLGTKLSGLLWWVWQVLDFLMRGTTWGWWEAPF